MGTTEVFQNMVLTLTSRFLSKCLRSGPVSRCAVVNLTPIRNQSNNMNIFDRNAKKSHEDIAAKVADFETYNYLKDEVGFRLADRIFDINKNFKVAVDLGCGFGHVSKHLSKVANCQVFIKYLTQVRMQWSIMCALNLNNYLGCSRRVDYV